MVNFMKLEESDVTEVTLGALIKLRPKFNPC